MILYISQHNFFLFLYFSLLPILLISQDLSGDWKTISGGGFYAELHLVKERNGEYSGHSYDEQSGGYCSYRLVGNYNKRNNLFEAKNTTVIQRSVQHRGSRYNLYYSKNGNLEYLEGTVRVESSSMVLNNGVIIQQPSPAINVRYIRKQKDPIIEFEKENEKIDFEEQEAVSVPNPEDVVSDTIAYEPNNVWLPIPEEIEIDEKKDPYVTAVRKPKDIFVEEPQLVEELPKEEKPKAKEPKVNVKSPPEIVRLSEDSLRRFKSNRENKVVKSFFNNEARRITIKISDYGKEDNDIISVFHNDEILIKDLVIENKQKQIKVKIDPKKVNKFTFIANNLGYIPPNTAKISIKIKSKEYREVFNRFTSNFAARRGTLCSFEVLCYVL